MAWFRELLAVAIGGLTARKVRTLLIMLGPVLGAAGIVELTVLCGHYNTIAMVLNGFDCQVPGGAKPLG